MYIYLYTYIATHLQHSFRRSLHRRPPKDPFPTTASCIFLATPFFPNLSLFVGTILPPPSSLQIPLAAHTPCRIHTCVCTCVTWQVYQRDVAHVFRCNNLHHTTTHCKTHTFVCVLVPIKYTFQCYILLVTYCAVYILNGEETPHDWRWQRLVDTPRQSQFSVMRGPPQTDSCPLARTLASLPSLSLSRTCLACIAKPCK